MKSEKPRFKIVFRADYVPGSESSVSDFCMPMNDAAWNMADEYSRRMLVFWGNRLNNEALVRMRPIRMRGIFY
jgi:hypothetical protein